MLIRAPTGTILAVWVLTEPSTMSSALNSKDAAVGSQSKTWAVIAFTPDDLPWFEWLFHQLEGYPIPSSLIGQPTRHGMPLPEKFSVFPDQWNPFNYGQYAETLATAGCLVVLCSPSAAHSTWIEEQIREFKTHGGEERIIVVVVESLPQPASREALPKNDDWLPSWIKWRLTPEGTFRSADSTEPVIIDARRDRAGFDEMRKQLIAALVGVSCEDLEQLGGLMPPIALAPPSVAAKPAPGEAVAMPDSGRPAKGATSSRGPAVVIAAMLCVMSVCAVISVLRKPAPAPPPATSVTVAQPPASTLPSPGNPSQPAPASSANTAAVPPSTATALETASKNPKQEAPVPANSVASTDPGPARVAPPLQPFTATPPVATPAPALTALDTAAIQFVRLKALGDSLLAKGRRDEAQSAYEEALPLVRDNEVLLTGASIDALEVAEMCRNLGILQEHASSTAEARSSWEFGRRILIPAKGSKVKLNPDRARCLTELEGNLRRLVRERD